MIKKNSLILYKWEVGFRFIGFDIIIINNNYWVFIALFSRREMYNLVIIKHIPCGIIKIIKIFKVIYSSNNKTEKYVLNLLNILYYTKENLSP